MRSRRVPPGLVKRTGWRAVLGMAHRSVPDPGHPSSRTATSVHPESDPTDLTAGEVSAELASLPRWTGDVHVLECVVDMPSDIGEELRARIARAEQALNHHAVIEERTDGTVFRVSTYMRDAVTDLDIVLALKISDIIDGGGVQTRP